MGYLSYLYRQFFIHPPPIPSSLSLKNQIVLITGANSGIGLEAARQCVKLEAELVILAVRSQTKGEAAKSDILRTNPDSTAIVEVWLLDLESFDSVVAFGKRINDLSRLDVAMLNAGVFKFAWETTTNGLESSLQVNHLSTALLSLLLLPVLRKTAIAVQKPSRLTFTSSEVHMWTPFKEQNTTNILECLNDKEYFKDYTDRYCVSKLLGVFWVRELATKIPKDVVILNLINPGSVDTGLHRDNKVFQFMDKVVGRTPEEGGRLLIDAAMVKGSESHGQYMSEAKLVELVLL
jgi:retinol dehydrogenase-12